MANEGEPKPDLTEGRLNAQLNRASIGATVYERNRTRGHVTDRQIEIGERDIARRKAAALEVLRRNAQGNLEGIQVRFKVEISLPPVPEEPQRDYKGRVEMDLDELGPEAYDLVMPSTLEQSS